MKNSSIKINPVGQTGSVGKSVGQLSVDVLQTEDAIMIIAPIAGVAEEDVILSITDDVLLIKGNRKPPVSAKDSTYFTKECFWGEFSRAIVLPVEADTEQIAASFDQHILKIHIPKRPNTSGTKIIKIKT